MESRVYTSVIIPTKDRPRDLIRCLDSITVQTLLPNQVIVVDAGSSDVGQADVLKRFKLRFSNLIYMRTEAGLTRQRNVGVKISKGDVVFFFDDDVVIEKDYIEQIVREFEEDEKESVGGIMGRIINHRREKPRNPNIKRPYIRFLFFMPMNGDGRFRLAGFPTYIHGFPDKIDIQFLSGCCSAYRRKVLNEFKFDEHLVGYCYMEDVDFSCRVSRKYRNVYLPSARLVHYPSSQSRTSEMKKKEMLIKNYYYLFRKNFPQTPLHITAFWLSLVGWLIEMVRYGNWPGLKGVMRGMTSTVQKKRN